MATYSVTTGPLQQRVLEWGLLRENEQRAPNPPITLAEYVQLVFLNGVRELKQPFDRWEAEELAAKYAAATEPAKAQARTAIGMG